MTRQHNMRSVSCNLSNTREMSQGFYENQNKIRNETKVKSNVFFAKGNICLSEDTTSDQTFNVKT